MARVSRALERYLRIHLWAISTRPMYRDYDVPLELAEAFEFKLLTIDELRSAAIERHRGLDAEFIQDARTRGDTCFAAIQNGSVVAYNWHSRTKAPVLENLWLQVEHPQAYYSYKSWVSPGLRGLRMSETLRGLYDAKFSSDELTSAFGYVSLHNLASMASLERNPEQKRCGYAVILNGKRKARTWCTSKARAWVSFESTEHSG